MLSPVLSPIRPKSGFRRWLNVLLRGLHLAAVIVVGAGLLGAPVRTPWAIGVMAASGVAMFALDLWQKPGYLREVAGLAVLAKLLLVTWMAVDAEARFVLFWLIVVMSAIFAHAPGSVRHAVLLHRNQSD